jgi:N-ethylmaleimide reductase
MSHPDFFDGALPMSASNVNPEQESVTPSGRKPPVAPRPMSKKEIRQTVADFGTAAKNAMKAGFDADPSQLPLSHRSIPEQRNESS